MRHIVWTCEQLEVLHSCSKGVNVLSSSSLLDFLGPTQDTSTVAKFNTWMGVILVEKLISQLNADRVLWV